MQAQKQGKSRALAPFVPTGVASLQLSRGEALHGCNESILRAHHCSWQRRDKRASSDAERPIQQLLRHGSSSGKCHRQR